MWRRKEHGRGPAGTKRVGERGSVLLMVIGVLALLAIIAVVYAAIGQADRRTGSALVRSTQVEDISGQVADYITKVIGQDVNEVLEEEYPGKSGSQIRRYRATWTYPSIEIDDTVRSQDVSGTQRQFKPVGGGYQPWLAPVEPTRIGYSNDGSPVPWFNENRAYLDARDWLSITNISPNGQFVNLTNLRDNFYAEPGIGTDAFGRPRMSEDLTLFGDSGLPYTAGNADKVDGTPADPIIPWHWTAFQRHAARPAFSFDTSAGQPGPGESEYLLNQWWDVDGDGIVDSRIFELNQILGVQNQEVVLSGLAQQDRMRYFIGVRIVDLNAMVNANTATDLLNPPGPLPDGASIPPPPIFPAGLSAADIDLLRALKLSDVYQRYGPQHGYNLLQQPATLTAAANYRDYTYQGGAGNARTIGEQAYLALGHMRRLGTLRGVDDFGDFALSGPLRNVNTLLERQEFYLNASADAAQSGYSQSVVVGTFGQAGASLAFRNAAPFGMLELQELHAFFGVNDAREQSRLEATLDGRSVKGPNIYPNLGPTRSNRDFDVERERTGDTRADGQQDDDSLLRQHIDLRHRLTTYNGARPLTSLINPARFNPTSLVEDEVRTDIRDFLFQANPNQISDLKLNRFFNLAFDAISPYRNMSDSEDVWDMTEAYNVGLHYGGDADLAYRAIAHWMLNLIDASDDDNDIDEDISGPTAISLVTVRNQPTGTTPDFPWPDVRLTNDDELAMNRTDVESQRVNLYGIEAQPFLVEAGSYAFFTDTPWDAGGDDEYGDAPTPGPGQPPTDLLEVTIDGDILTSNVDFLGEVVAFQITNPFDRDIYLTKAGTTGGTPQFIYYIEYANRYFPLAEFDETGGTGFLNVDVKLYAGETRTFYATSPTKELNFNTRFRNSHNSTHAAPNPPVPTDFLQRWVNTQLRTSPSADTLRRPIHTAMFDPTSGALVSSTSSDDDLEDLHGDTFLAATPEQRKVIQLWRVMRAPNGTETPTTNRQENDLLADRMRDEPGAPTMRQRLDVTTDEVDDTQAGNDHRNINFGGGNPPPYDNTGLSITLWGAIRRPTNPVLNAQDSFVGAIPPWCMETRIDSVYAWDDSGEPRGESGIGQTLNKSFTGPAGRGNRTDYGASGRSQYRNLGQLAADQASGSGGTSVNEEMRQEAEDKKGNRVPKSQSMDLAGNAKDFNQQAMRFYMSGRDIDGTLINPGMFRRISDILLPLAIGPYYDPHHPDVNRQRMTLSEAIAMAMDYYSPDEDSLYYRAGHTDDSTGVKAAFDRGHFAVDRWAPYYDLNENRVFDPSASNVKERTLGLGIPLALNLLDKFRVTPDGGLSKSEIGKLSLNTAPVLNLSLLPMLAPDPLSPWIVDSVPGKRESIYRPVEEQLDIATTIVAFRDKVDMRTRPKMNVNTGSGVATPVNNSTAEISFRDQVNPLREPWLHDGRRVRTGINALHETPGFRSIGEILAARLENVPSHVTNPYEYQSNSIDRYERDRSTGNDPQSLLGQFGIESATMQGRAASHVRNSDEMPADYAEKLTIAGAVLNNVTVRSDTFVVWFMIHGYLPSDVQGLGPNDPLTPTVAKRYMMVVDRTNVVKEGDTPRILMIREVPL